MTVGQGPIARARRAQEEIPAVVPPVQFSRGICACVCAARRARWEWRSGHGSHARRRNGALESGRGGDDSTGLRHASEAPVNAATKRLRRENERLKRKIDHLEKQLATAEPSRIPASGPLAPIREGRRGRPGRRSAGAAYGRHGGRPRWPSLDEHPASAPAVRTAAARSLTLASGVAVSGRTARGAPGRTRFDIEVMPLLADVTSGCRADVLQTSDALGAAGVRARSRRCAGRRARNGDGGAAGEGWRTCCGPRSSSPARAGRWARPRAAGCGPPAPPRRAYTVELCDAGSQRRPWSRPRDRLARRRRTNWLPGIGHPRTRRSTRSAPARGFDDAARCLGPVRRRARARRDRRAPYRCYDGLAPACLNHFAPTLQAPPGGSSRPSLGRRGAGGPAGRPRLPRGTAATGRAERARHGARGRLNARPSLGSSRRTAGRSTTREPFAAPPGQRRAVFLFLWDPSLDATNWRAEQAIQKPWSAARCAAATASRWTPSRCSPELRHQPANASSLGPLLNRRGCCASPERAASSAQPWSAVPADRIGAGTPEITAMAPRKS